MSMYREEVNKYKAKRIGQTDAKVVAPKGLKKKVAKPWVVVVKWHYSGWTPSNFKFAKEQDARSYLRKMQLSNWKDCHLEYNGEKVE